MLSSLAKILVVIALLSACATHQAQPAVNEPKSPRSLTESELDAALQKSATESLSDREGSIIVIDPQSGRLRAVVNPRLAYEQSFPPGSAIKPFTALAALRAGLIHREFRHQCLKRYAHDGFEIVCSHPVSNAPFNLSQALAYSCNNFFARVGQKLSEGSFNSTLGSFGFGEKTGVNANEVAGTLPKGDWGVRDTLGESEHLLVTPVQLITAYTALINGGYLYRPQRSDNRELNPQLKHRLNIMPEHRAMLIEGMRGAVKYGTASNAGLGSMPGYIFGKTGTSTSSVRWRTQGWFVGFMAEKNPIGSPSADRIKLGVLVFLKRSHGSQAAEIAKPIFERLSQLADKVSAGELGKGRDDRRDPGNINVSFPILNPQSINLQKIKVRSISENITREETLEQYLVGVLSAESSVENEMEALKAQAVVSRTFALKNRGRHASEGYDFCSTTHCQRFVIPKTKTAATAAARRAVEETAGVILKDPLSGGSGADRIVDAYFHSSCGGMTANIETLWGAPAPSYLRGVRDDFCATSPHRRWTQKIPVDQLTKAFQSDERTNVGARLASITVTRRDATGRAEVIAIDGQRRRLVRGWDFKLIVGRSLGWQMIKSSKFEVSRIGNDFIFRGSGFGHGLGLCQEGSHVAARRGMNYRQILDHYFPGTRLTVEHGYQPAKAGERIKPGVERVSAEHQESCETKPKPADAGDRASLLSRIRYRNLYRLPPAPQAKLVCTTDTWGSALTRSTPGFILSPAFAGSQSAPKSSLSSEHFRVIYPANADVRAIKEMLGALENARAAILRRLEAASLGLSESAPFEVVVHASTADFIAATGQSGWAAGATRGRKIELQPLSLLKRRGVLNSTLRHEMTHAVIEVLSGGRAPRWMAEGLAIYVAGESATLPKIDDQGRLETGELEARLARPSQIGESRKLYAMAYHKIRAMIEAEGEASVWRRVARHDVRGSKRLISPTTA